MPTQLEYIEPQDRFKGDVPLSLAVKVGKHVFTSGVPGYDSAGQLAVDDFSAQMNQAMENIAAILDASGTGWDCVVRAKVFLKRQADFDTMNRIYASYFEGEKYPARTTMYVHALPQPDFLVEIECEAILPEDRCEVSALRDYPSMSGVGPNAK
jgi:2-iminobutanoate/2-iminopropanoate deaminase